ncbi:MULTISPECIES: hypothetical protein [Metallosphaera]|uniref:Archaeal Type IV pilin N-terminal domain-containing protein n=3 Tax=Metallosphaera TaxID=41980 RepID=A4YH94_METS5|nr:MULTISPECIES: hypothetical protein [Metallosphaera]ABP95796.1 hypothetical protein Msed_1641 [Metallosphaera sedula DSM 5348]AIM27780.1 hypothetical protein HA72_1641 [Metallosphaera sedula]AKV74632.1 hypothetical protein MsedA_1670 [Metallosphaera sedula]AKV76870.1 hypothetical protein MsedB_1672 [Metallosphaera sedula]AKV79121.1 hypothetical protein MsedC_1670 [Metallosphaera sedula]
MPENIVQEIILISVVVALGIAIVAFSISVLYPQIILTSEEQTASNIASQTTLSVGPLLVNSTSGSLVLEVYDPAESGNVSIVAFYVPQSFEPSISLVTPTSPPSSSTFKVYSVTGALDRAEIISRIYDLNGQILYNSPLTAYSVPFNTPVTVFAKGYQQGDIIVIWVLYGQGDTFRIGYTFTGVPSS